MLSGTVYTCRDQAHKRLMRNSSKSIVKRLKGSVIYYCGPTRAPKGKAISTSTTLSANGEQGRQRWPRRTIGSCGPTTASRMDEFSPFLLRAGIKVMIGKGRRSQEVRKAIGKYRGVYFVTFAGCGALLSKFVGKAEPVFFKELGPEAIYKLEVKDFPLITAIDSKGRSIYG